MEADVTVSFHAAKLGHWIAPGKAHTGELRVAEIGIPAGAPGEPAAGVIADGVLGLAPRRTPNSTKFDSGQVLVVGGSRGLTGAVCMAAEAAIRVGRRLRDGGGARRPGADLRGEADRGDVARVRRGGGPPGRELGRGDPRGGGARGRGRPGPGAGARRGLARARPRGRAADRGAAPDRRGRAERPRRAPRLDRRAGRAHGAHASRRRARPPARDANPARWPSTGSPARARRRSEAGRSSCSRATTPWSPTASGLRSAPAAAPGSPPPAPATCSRARSGRCSLAAWSPSRPPARASTRISSPGRIAARRLGAAESVIATDVIAALPAALKRDMSESRSSAPSPSSTRAPWSATAPGWPTSSRGSRLCAVVKADGYGHGAVECARAALAGGATWLAVAAAAEAAELRSQLPDARILTMGALTEAELDLALGAESDVAVWRPGFAEPGRRARGRAGRAPARARQVRHRHGPPRRARPGRGARPGGRGGGGRAPRARRAVDPLRHRRRARLGLLRRAARALRARSPSACAPSIPDLLVHAANSAATLRDPASHFDMARCGIAIYGLDPFHSDPFARGLEPALELRSYVADTKRFPAGASAGYGRRWRAPADTWVGVLPIGYGDGVRRGLTNNGEALVGGKRYPFVGTVSMDNVTVDLGPCLERGARLGRGADRRPGRRSDPLRGGGSAPGDDQLRDHLRDRAAGAPRAGPLRRPVSAAIAELLAAAPAVRACQEALGAAEGAWIVGGAIRDAALGQGGQGPRPGGRRRRAGRPPARSAAWRGGPVFTAVRGVRQLARPGGATAPGTWTSPGCAATESRRTWPCATSRSTRSRSRWPTRPRRCVDPHGGLADLEARVLRAVSARSFADDPLRILRAARIAAGLELEVDPETAALARAEAGRAGGAGGRAPVRRAAPAAHGRRPGQGAAAPGRARGDAGPAARARGASRRRAEPVPPPRRPRAHHGGAGAADRGGGRPRGLRRRGGRRTFAQLLAEPLADELTRGGALRFAALVPRPRQAGDARRGRGRPGAVHRPRSRRCPPRPRALLAPAGEPAARRLPGQPDPQPPAARLPGPRAAAVAAPRLRLPAGHRSRLGRRHAAHGRRPARHPGRAHPAGGGRRPPRAGPRDDRRGAGLASRPARRARRSAATSWPPSWASSRAPSSAACWARSRRRCSRARSRRARRPSTWRDGLRLGSQASI